MTPDHEAFKAGMWIQRKIDKKIGWIQETQIMKSVICIPETGEMSLEWNTAIHLIRGKTCADDLYTLMDIALLTGDKNWFNELSAQYEKQWREERGITS